MSIHVAILIFVILILIINVTVLIILYKAVKQIDIPKILTEKDTIIKDINDVYSTVTDVKTRVNNLLTGLKIKNI